MSVQIVDNFISNDQAKAIVNALSPYLVASERFGMAESRFPDPMETLRNIYDGKSVFKNKEFEAAGLLYTDTINRVAKEINNFYGVDVVPINPMFAEISEGGKNDGLHCDSVQLDGTPWEDGNVLLEDLEFSALVYLNTCGQDYEGGKISFPNQELEIAPKTGQMIFFRGDIDHPHGVSEVTSGKRHALVLFYGRSDKVRLYLQYKAGKPMGF
jgi:predicted 2-oxoglutarate/Fe(II)-dependent dioxygenase YbiX